MSNIENVKPITINSTFMWPFLTETNKMSGKYQVDLTQLSPAAVEALEMMGCTVLNKPDKGDFVTVKSNHSIRVYDTDGKEITGVQVGNGTTAKCVIKPYHWKSPAGKAGVSPSLMKAIVTELVIYGGGEGSPEAMDFNLDEAL